MEPQLPRMFGLLPKSGLDVRPVEPYREKEFAMAQYYEGTPDGSRRGAVIVNTGDYEHRSLVQVETTAYHEGIPGHHLQTAVAQTLPELPPFRQNGDYNAYSEGWVLYAESLGKEMGFFQDPTRITAACLGSLCAPCDSCWTQASITATGLASR
jgi:uncharacterized protein (DUF885 family)